MPIYLKIKYLLKQISLILISIILFLSSGSIVAFANSYPNNTNNTAMAVGIDVSKWNKGKIDWNAVKEAGFSFVIIKISKRNPKSTISDLVDERFEEFYAGAGAAGLKRGVYVFNYASNVDEAISEAEACLKTLNGRPLELPIAYDIENYSTNTQNRLTKKGKNVTAEAINAFCDTVEDAGYQSMIYTGTNFIKKYINYDMISDRRLWLARYPKLKKNPTYQDYVNYKASEFPYYIWQFTSLAYVPTASYTSTKKGKTIHHCDVNFIYDPEFADDGIEKLRNKTLQNKSKDKIDSESEDDLEDDTEDDTEDTTSPSDNNIIPTALFFNKTYIDLDGNNNPTYKLELSVFPAEASQKTISFLSSDTEIATVDNNGILTPKKSGTVVITAVSGSVNTTTTINIKKDVVKPASIQLNEYEVLMNINDNFQLKPTIKPANITESVQYLSLDPNVASVDNTGKVTALKEGETVITASLGTLTAECDITVENEDKTENKGNKNEDKNKKKNKKKEEKDKKKEKEKEKNEDGDKNKEKDKKDEDNEKNKNKETDTSSSKIDIIKSSIKIGVNEVYKVELKSDKSIKNDDIIWHSSDTKIISGYDNGVMTAKSKGSVILTAKLKSDPTIKDTVKITVLEAPTSISLNKKSITLKKSATYKLKPKFNKGEASAKINYKSSNSKIVKVSKKGNIKGIKKGTATITLSTYNKKTATIKVTVK